jgi:hypothetical protein
MELLELAKLVESGESAAFTAMFQAAPPDFAAATGLQIGQFGPATAYKLAKFPAIIFNRVIGAGLTEPATPRMMDRIIEFYRNTGTRFAVQISPAAQPAQLPVWLEERGLKFTDNWAKVYRLPDPAPAIATELTVERIGTAQAATFARVCMEAFGIPPALDSWIAALVGRPGWQHFLAYAGEQPVAAGALFVQNEVGWLGLGSTLPSHRRLGGQGAIMARRIEEARRQGCRFIITETGEDTPRNTNPSYHNMLRTGFKLAYQRPNYISS